MMRDGPRESGTVVAHVTSRLTVCVLPLGGPLIMEKKKRPQLAKSHSKHARKITLHFLKFFMMRDGPRESETVVALVTPRLMPIRN